MSVHGCMGAGCGVWGSLELAVHGMVEEIQNESRIGILKEPKYL